MQGELVRAAELEERGSFEDVARLLADPNSMVRQAAAQALDQQGERGAKAAKWPNRRPASQGDGLAQVIAL